MSSLSSIKCFNCNKTGHYRSECTFIKDLSKVVCFRCNKTGHYRSDCTNKRDVSKITCHGCGEIGHLQDKCPKEKKIKRKAYFKNLAHLNNLLKKGKITEKEYRLETSNTYICRKCYFGYDDSYGDCECGLWE